MFHPGVANSNVVPAAANKLAFSTQPQAAGSTVAGSTTGFTQPVVTIQDIYGNNTGSGTNAIALTVFKDIDL